MTEKILVELEVKSNTLVESLLEVIEHQRVEVKGFDIRERI